MYKDKKIVVCITARGGSKGIPRKNIKLLRDKPLIAYAITAGLTSKYADRTIVSTDDKEIAEIAKQHGAEVPFMRPAKLATDKAPSLPVLQHMVAFLETKEKYQPDIIVLIQPTSPMVLNEDVDKAIEQLFKTSTNSCVSVSEITDRPEYMYTLKDNKITPFLKKKSNITRRQDMPKIHRVNGAVYVTKRDVLMKKNKIIDLHASAIIMPRERSFDIDEPIDFEMIEHFLHLKDRDQKSTS